MGINTSLLDYATFLFKSYYAIIFLCIHEEISVYNLYLASGNLSYNILVIVFHFLHLW